MPPLDSGKSRARDGGRGTKQASQSRRLQNNTIMFFDWDDTILASTVLCTNGVTLSSPTVPEEIIQQFESLQDQIIKIFDVAFTYTKHIFVITNAERGWVELSAQKFMPRVYQRIEKLNFVISARTTYQNLYPNRPDLWKKTAFIERINSCFGRQEDGGPLGPSNVNVISFGDSECERTALMSITELCAETASLKSIKLVERPTTEQLKRQLEMIMNNFHFIVRHPGSLDLMLQISTLQASPSQPAPQQTAQTQQTPPVPPPSVTTPSASSSSSSSSSSAPTPPPPITSPSGLSSQSTGPLSGPSMPYNSPDGRVPEEMRREFERQQQQRRL